MNGLKAELASISHKGGNPNLTEYIINLNNYLKKNIRK